MKQEKRKIVETKKSNGIYIMEVKGNTKHLRGNNAAEKLQNAIKDFLRPERNDKREPIHHAAG